MVNRPYTVGLIIPTGIGASVGGYAGDALPVARALSQVCDRLITHPNVLNGAQLYWPIANALYVEGYALDQFAAGQWGLQPVHQNRIGLLLDAAIEPELRWRHLQVADAARATLGLDLTDYVVTDQPLGVELRTAPSGATWGTIQAPDSLLRAAHRLIHDVKADAIAVIARFPDDPGTEALENYRHGQGVDPLAGAEAVISHLVVRQFQVPCAHAPALEPLPLDPTLSPKSAAEEIGYTFLPCVLAGLSRAPQFIDRSQGDRSIVGSASATTVWRDQLDAFIVPETACGGSATLHLSQSRTRIITIRENSTRMQAGPRDLGITTISVQSYLEAIGVIAAHRAGISPAALGPSILPLQESRSALQPS
ncbi:DUF3326 domain-containing protein [Alkalinema sp. FACHB-956]|uniref:DUF3326 domain-containing protein n=1 Tax=Alkalinema sp. FACHB-956 TaxID=2692768 RepID=UPI0016870C97|nr:DUF3326 domain-containing protein [Alkalinema sp. FACHB-956]MBD2327522.1 DUF3326 domain-containing protein [Alkalinema sp. FACHB-956]